MPRPRRALSPRELAEAEMFVVDGNATYRQIAKIFKLDEHWARVVVRDALAGEERRGRKPIEVGPGTTRVCSCCGESKVLFEAFRRDATKCGGYSYICKVCRK